MRLRDLGARLEGSRVERRIDQVPGDVLGRCREVKLRVVGRRSRVELDAPVVLTVGATDFFYSRPRWIGV